VRIHLYVERSERDELHRAAEERGITVSALARGIIMNALKKLGE